MTCKVMILAAGLGQRMRPLTDQLPKPLLEAGGKPLLQYHLEALKYLGASDVIINLAYLGNKIRDFVAKHENFGLNIAFSAEFEPLETGGALLKALPMLGHEPFMLINGDVWTEYPLANLTSYSLAPDEDAHLIMVPNPDFHPMGDFSLNQYGRLENNSALPKFTFAGISLIHPRLIIEYPEKRQKFPLSEVLLAGIAKGRISAEVYSGKWSDVGTPERLTQLDSWLSTSQLK